MSQGNHDLVGSGALHLDARRRAVSPEAGAQADRLQPNDVQLRAFQGTDRSLLATVRQSVGTDPVRAAELLRKWLASRD